MKRPNEQLRDALLAAIGLDNSQCDLPLKALIQKVAAERTDLIGWWAPDGGKCLVIEHENGDVDVIAI